jgi:hypothetical protein
MDEKFHNLLVDGPKKKNHITLLSMDEKFHNLLVDGPKKTI